MRREGKTGIVSRIGPGGSH